MNNLGLALGDQGKFEEAIAILRKAVAIDPLFAPGHSNLGEVLKAQGSYEEAIVAYRKAIELDPKSAGHVNLGMVLKHSLGREKEALAAFRRGVEARADFLYAIHTQIALLLLWPEDKSLRDVDQAMTHARKAIRLAPNESDPYRALGRTLDALGNADREVINTYRTGLEQPTGFKGALHDQLARKLANCDDISLRDPAQAILHAEEAISLAPGTDGEAHATVSLGMAYYRAGQWTDCVDALETARKLKGSNLTALPKFFLAMAYWKSGEELKAQKSFDGAVDLASRTGNNDASLLRLRAEAATVLGVEGFSTGEQKSRDTDEEDARGGPTD